MGEEEENNMATGFQKRRRDRLGEGVCRDI
jgi:hypothetical protein